MPRAPRSDLAGQGTFHVTARGVAKTAIYRDDDDRRAFLGLFAHVVQKRDWHCHVFCLMGNHYHFVAECFLDDLSEGLRVLNGVYAQRFNARYERSGHLFGDRFASWAIESDEHLGATCEYVLENPVRAGLCERAEDWPWSGSRALRDGA